MRVYLVTNKIDGKMYVGQTTHTLALRWLWHQKNYDQTYFTNAVRKYGADAFEVTELCKVSSIEELNKMERLVISLLNTTDPKIGYNIKLGGAGGGRWSEELKRKLSAKRKGAVFSDQHRANLAVSLRKFFASPKGKETLAKRPRCSPSPATREKLRRARTGVKFSPEWCAKLSQSKKGLSVSLATRLKISQTLRSRKVQP